MAHISEFKQLISSIILLYYNSINKLKKTQPLNITKISNYVYYFHDNLKILFGSYNIKISINETIDIILCLLHNHTHIKKLFNIFNKISKKCNKKIKKIKKTKKTKKTDQSGGFFYNKFDNVFTKILNVVDILIDILSIIPNHFLTNTLHHFIGPYQLVSSFTNLVRGNYLLAFFSFISIIPGIGPVVGSSLKLMHHIIVYILEKLYASKEILYLQDVEIMKHVYKLDDFDPIKKYGPPESLDEFEYDFYE